MELKFEQLDYQIDAVNAVARLFEGQPNRRELFSLQNTGMERFVGNTLNLAEEQISKNLKQVQATFGLPETAMDTHGLNFSVEMETGTGKTYVYLRTIFEMNRRYGWTKFIIVVPSVAIREGVLQTLKSTRTHFAEVFNKPVMNFTEYDSKRLGALRNFAVSDGIEIMVINIQSFEKDGNVINQINEIGDAPIELIRQTSPIVIVDEPQNMETENRLAALKSFNPLFVLRYSATHKNSRHKVYSLNPVEAYNKKLVKQIVVQSVLAENDGNGAFVELLEMQVGKGSLKAKLNIHYRDKKETRKKAVTVKSGDDLFDKSGSNEAYRYGYIVNSLDAEDGRVDFSNGLSISRSDNQDVLQDEVMKAQIRCTIEEHLKRERKLKPLGIKVLSLFFIDKVAHYRAADGSAGKFAQWFAEIYRELTGEDAKGVHDGYFSQDKQGRLKDTNGTTQADNDTYHSIICAKEMLLSFDSPLSSLRFIFSHSALKEGWDNPNVFQICTLNETRSPIKKRQEIGRGLRLAVNQDGERVYDEGVNVLTVIPNESYESFAKKLQEEYEDECGIKFAASNIKDGRRRETQKFRPGFPLDPKFKEIWQKLDRKPRYRVQYDTQELIKQAAEAVSRLPEIHKPKIQTRKAKLEQSMNDGVAAVEIGSGSLQTEIAIVMPDLLGEIQNKTGLTRRTVFEILKASGHLQYAEKNPQRFIDLAAEHIKRCLHALMAEGIAYTLEDNERYRQQLLINLQEMEREGTEFYLDDYTFTVNNEGKTIAKNYIPLDSDTEKQFASDCENHEDITLYFKLPHWFKIPTPLGSYNPDWAIVKQNGAKAYFIAETKNTGQGIQEGVDESKLREEEQLKIRCARAYFRQMHEVTYQVVTKVVELDNP